MSSHPEGAVRRAVFLAVMLAGLVFVPLAGSAAAAGKPHDKGGPAQILVLSNRADLISGGDALVEIVLPDKVDPATVTVKLNGTDITSAVGGRPQRGFEGVVSGRVNGGKEGTGGQK